MHLLVTGAAGFIGTNFVRLLMAETQHTVVALDVLTYAGKRENLQEFEGSGRYRFVLGDIASREDLLYVIRDQSFDAVVNFAAESHVDRSIHDASTFITTNVRGTQHCLDLCREYRVPRFLQVSTDEVYGDLDEDQAPFDETCPLRPSSPYAASKAAADLLVLAAYRTHGLDVVITRCTNNFGPYQHPEKLIPMVIQRARALEPIPVYGTGRNIRDWIYVEDHCRGVLASLERGIAGQVYNLGGGTELRNIEVIQRILGILEVPGDLLRFVTDRPGHDRRYALDIDKARDKLGYEPRLSFDIGIAKTLEWYSGHREWLSDKLSPHFQAFRARHYGELS